VGRLWDISHIDLQSGRARLRSRLVPATSELAASNAAVTMSTGIDVRPETLSKDGNGSLGSE
jgi:hypothetical protein